ncbi:MAG TPA: hypothetical protein DF296_14425 [Candidatus Margulisbacteria bacterium]|nr:MAG: hypothetical protein A2X43_13000 [Candidatus Margulisbacteria bacterium GWD2_39_127]HAR62870.1 hypothetical protein [Candidatus Margulisiibacteriota bacterium]HCT86383.1 hypothetical protein [Candidatus Margulisiibacteriota bacterium]
MAKKIITGIIVLSTLFILVSAIGIFYFSNVIMYPPKMSFEKYRMLHPDQETHPGKLGLPYRDETISINKPDNKCLGWYLPASKKSDKLIILVHGRGVNRLNVLKYAPYLHAAGYNLFLMDFRNCGLSYSAPCSMGFFESQELVVAADYLDKKYHNNSVGIIGFSMGAAVTTLAAPHIKNIKALVLDSPFYSFRSIIEERTTIEQPYIPIVYVDLVLRFIGARLSFDTDNVDLGKELRTMHIPLFLIHGKKDTYISKQHSLRIYKTANGPKQIWLTENGTHVESFSHHEKDYKKKTLDFLARYLN